MDRTLTIEGMHCENCARKLTTNFSKVPGVIAAHVALNPPEAHITTTTDVPLSDLQNAASAAGSYKLRETKPAASVAHAHHQNASSPDEQVVEKKPTLYPLVLIITFIAGTVLIAHWSRGTLDWRALMLDFMAGFFLVFSFFKLLDLKGFADAYQTYDLLAKHARPWALSYPFIELALGIAYITRWQLPLVNAITLILMLLGSLGVLRALLKKNAIRCACLGTALNLPMTTVTLVEDLAMAAMAAAMLLWPH